MLSGAAAFIIGNEISEMTVLLFADWRFERNGFLSDFYDFTEPFSPMPISSAISSGRGLSAEFLKQLPVNANELVDASTMCTGILIVRAWSAIARVIAWRIHHVEMLKPYP